MMMIICKFSLVVKCMTCHIGVLGSYPVRGTTFRFFPSMFITKTKTLESCRFVLIAQYTQCSLNMLTLHFRKCDIATYFRPFFNFTTVPSMFWQGTHSHIFICCH